ncbi:MAG: DUF4169 family protein [Propylenella sp.]
MSEIVNLRQARKRKRRAVKEREAAANRAAHGVPSAEKRAARATEALAEKRLEGHRREPDREG